MSEGLATGQESTSFSAESKVDAPAKRLKVLLSAYACEPGKGSEPGVGWNMAVEMSRLHDVTVLTRSNNRVLIEEVLQQVPTAGLRVVYHDLPRWASWWKRGGRGVQLYYYLWQVSAWPLLRRLHRQRSFDVVHHVTFGKYWAPSMLALLGVPFVWGVVGGGEAMPRSFESLGTTRARSFERVRRVARWVGELDPLVRLTARRSACALVATEETARRVRRLRAKDVRVMPQCALTVEQQEALSKLSWPNSRPLLFISMGRPEFWKGFELGLQAFARCNPPNAEYWLLANGPGRGRLEQRADQLGVLSRVKFIDPLPTLDEVYAMLSQCHVLVHPALHEAFGNVVLEAMAAGRPVISLDLGGPALQIGEEMGFKASSGTPETAINEIGKCMVLLASDPDRARTIGQNARQHVLRNMTWSKIAATMDSVYRDVTLRH